MEVQQFISIAPWTIIFQILNLLLLMVLFKKYLFKPVTEILEKRQAEIEGHYQEAQQAEAAGEPVDDPAKNCVFPSSLAFLREKAVAIADMAELPRSRQYPNAKVYLAFWKPALLGAGCADAEALTEIVTICRPLWDIETGLSCEDTMARLEENVTSGDYQDALELLGISDMIPITTQGGT